MAPIADGRLLGTWRLDSWTAQTDHGPVARPFGEEPVGSIVYTSEGWMTVMIAAGERARLESADIVGGSEAERAQAFSTFMAYCGPYTITDDVVVHHIAMSMFPNWVGVDQKRHFTLSDDELVLESQPFEIDGDMVVNTLRWAREQ